jgi:hypothetical protein
MFPKGFRKLKFVFAVGLIRVVMRLVLLLRKTPRWLRFSKIERIFQRIDDFAKSDAFFGLQGLFSAAASPNLEAIESDHKELQKDLRAFDRIESMTLIAGLLTYPQFHANTVRLELLQTLLHRNAAGSSKPTRKDLEHWLNESLLPSWASRMEDPVEDVFISNAVSNVGNTRIFEGIWEANDFWLQQALDALRAFRGIEWVDRLFDNCLALLSLSDALAERCGLERYNMGGGNVRGPLVLPQQADLEQRGSFAQFSRRDIEELGVNFDHLSPYVHPDEPAQGAPGRNTLDWHPLVPTSDGILVAIPAAISPALRRHIADEIVRAGAIEQYERRLFSNQIRQLFSQGMQGLDTTRIASHNLPDLPNNTPVKIQEVAQFDRGKFAHVLFFEDRILDFLQTGMSGVLEFEDDTLERLIEHSNDCAEELSKQPNYSGGLTIAVVGGLGRAFAFAVPPLPVGWYMIGFRLPDLLALSRVRGTNLLQLWKLNEQQAALASRGVHIFNINGELNLLGFWKDNGERLLPSNAPSQNFTLTVGTNYITEVRRDLREKYNFHATPRRNPDVWIPVRRQNVDPFFKEVIAQPTYVDEGDVLRGRLRGVVETQQRPWWVSSLQRLQVEFHRDTQFRVWDATLSWMQRIAVVGEQFVSAIAGPIEVFLRFDEMEKWTSQHIDVLPEPAGELQVAVSRRIATIQIRFPVSFFRWFAKPENIAERKLIRGCLIGIGALGGQRLGSNQLDELVEQVAQNSEARFFHLVYAQSYRAHAGFSDPIKPSLVREGDVNFACVGLSQSLLEQADATEVNGHSDCNGFLHGVVDHCWEKLRSMFALLDRRSLIERALQNVEAIELDKERWKMTANALLAVHKDRQDVVEVATERERNRAAAELASRIVCEVAICACPTSGGRLVNDAELQSIMAIMELLIYSAHSSDALQYALTPARIHVFPNGEFAVDNTYQKNVLLPYINEHFTRLFESHAQSYSEYFARGDQPEEKPKADFPVGFVEAFSSEYGLTPDELFLAYRKLEKDAMTDEQLVVTRTSKRFRELLLDADLSSASVDALLANFSLVPRENWDRAPVGFTNKDWYPWRYRRRLSLVMRPFLQTCDSDENVIFAPALVRDSIELLFYRLLTGRLPADDFRSSQMRSWIGEITRIRGEEFENAVAKQVRECGLQAVASKSMTELGADASYGDLDVLAWNSDGSIFYPIECKRLRFARTVSEVGEQLREFRGEEMDRLARHVRRCEWLKQNAQALRSISKTTSSKIKIIPALVTSTVVPMQFVAGLPLESKSIFALSRIREWISSNR